MTRTGLTPPKTDADNEWVLDFSNFYEAWKLPPEPDGKSMGEGIIVAHPDTGWTTHPELWDDNTIIDGELADDRYLTKQSRNFAKPRELAIDRLPSEFGIEIVDLPPEDPAWYFSEPRAIPAVRFPGHGTATASVLMSKRGGPPFDEFPDYFPDLPGRPLHFVSGVAPLVKVIPYKVTESVLLDGQAFVSLAKSIHYAAHLSRSSTVLDDGNSQIGVISISLGGMGQAARPSLPVALQAARRAGIVVIAAAGQINDVFGKYGSPIYPGNDQNTICVAACGPKHEKYTKGFYGDAVDITAPGDKIWVARAKRVPNQLNNYFAEQSHGTSYATAIVAGACALWQAHHGRAKLLAKYGPELIFDVFKKALKESCDTPPRWDTKKRGAGVLDAKALLEWPGKDKPLPSKAEIEDEIRSGRTL